MSLLILEKSATTWSFISSGIASFMTLTRGEARRWNTPSGLNFWISVASGDTASCASPIQKTFAEHYPQVEFWVQDLTYRDDLPHFQLGGFAQNMTSVPDGFFGALTLHNSFEHFMGNADSDFVREVDRVLGPTGACLILPLYVASTPRIYFDPVAVTPSLLRTYDKEAELIPVRGFASQEHARCYDATTLQERLISRVPPTLEATIIDFSGGESIAPEMFPEFALVLHRKKSIFRCETASS